MPLVLFQLKFYFREAFVLVKFKHNGTVLQQRDCLSQRFDGICADGAGSTIVGTRYVAQYLATQHVPHSTVHLAQPTRAT